MSTDERRPSTSPPPTAAREQEEHDGPLGLRREPLTAAAATWLGLQLLLAVLGVRGGGSPLLGAGAAVTATALCVVLVRPLRSGRVVLGRRTASVVVLGVLGVSALNVVAALPGSTGAGALWFPGLVAPLVGVLAVRGRPLHGLAAALLASVVVVLTWLGDDGPRGWWLPQTFVSAAPLALWWVGGVLVRHLVSSTRLDLRRSDGAFSLALDRRERTREREAARERRRLLLETTAVPLLELAAQGQGPPTQSDRVRMAAVEAELRAELRGRDLLDGDVRRAAGRARGRGVRVDVVDHAPPGADARTVGRLRTLAAAALEAAEDGELTARRPPSDVVMTLVHVGSARSLAAVEATVRERCAALRLTAEVSADEDAVVVDVVR